MNDTDRLLEDFFTQIATTEKLLAKINELTNLSSPLYSWKELSQQREALQLKMQEELQELGWHTLKVYNAGLLDSEEESEFEDDSYDFIESDDDQELEKNQSDKLVAEESSSESSSESEEDSEVERRARIEAEIAAAYQLRAKEEQQKRAEEEEKARQLAEQQRLIEQEKAEQERLAAEAEAAKIAAQNHVAVDLNEDLINDLTASFFKRKEEPTPVKKNDSAIYPKERIENPNAVEAWEEVAMLLKRNNSRTERSECFNMINRAFSKDYFTMWKNDFSDAFDDITRFFISTLLYIKKYPYEQRPLNALGDGAYEHFLRTIKNYNATSKKYVEDFYFSNFSKLELLDKMEKFWTRVEKKRTEFVEKQDSFDINDALSNLAAAHEREDQKTFDILIKKVCNRKLEQKENREFLSFLMDKLDFLDETQFWKLRASVKNYIEWVNEPKKKEEENSEEDSDMEFEEWDLAQEFAEKRILLVGGDKGRILTDNCERLLPYSTIKWVQTSPNEGYRKFQSTLQSIKQDQFDFILILQRFVSHAVSNEIHKTIKSCNINTKHVLIDKGYGQQAIKDGLLSCLERE